MMALPLTAKRSWARWEGGTSSEMGLGGAVMEVAEPSLNFIDGGIRDVYSFRAVDILGEARVGRDVACGGERAVSSKFNSPEYANSKHELL